MTYELWSGPSGNIVGAFPSRNEALAAAREVAERNGPDYVESLALILEDDAGESQLIAEGGDLMRLIQGGAPVARR